MTYALTLLTFFCIAIILAMSLNLVMGYTGRVSVAHGGFMAVGAYGTAWFAINAEMNLVWAMLVGAAVAGVVGWIFGAATARISGDEFILASFALQMVLIEMISRWASVTRGTYGLSGIPRPVLFGQRLSDVESFAAFVVVVTLLCGAFVLRLGHSTFGLALRGVRESERSMQALGRNTTSLKAVAFVIASCLAGIAGGLQASMVSFIHPDNFGVMVSIIVIAYLLVGGLGSMLGAALGAVMLLSIPEVIAATDWIPTNLLGPLERVLYGLALILFVWLRPQGLLPERPILNVARMRRRGLVTIPDPQEVTR